MVTAHKADTAKRTTTYTTPSDVEILVTRVFDAPRRLVFDAFTDPKHLPHWMTGTWVMHICEIDLRPGGAYRFGWREPNGTETMMQIIGVYKEVVPGERLVGSESWGDGWPETVNTVVFAEENGKTTMTLRIKYPSKEARDAALESGMKAGLSLNFQHLDSYLGSATSFVADPLTQEIVMTRVFDAPRAMVFKAFTEAKAIEQWWGPRWLTNTVERMEARQGGVWRIVQRDVNGREYAFHGVFHESCGPERLVRTFEYEGTPGKVVLETVAFERLGDRTRVTTQSVFQSVADRDGMMTSGAELGARESFERLAELLAGQLV